MKNYTYILVVLLFMGCSSLPLKSYFSSANDNSVPESIDEDNNITQEEIDEDILPKSILDDAQAFYPMRETLDGIQTELDDLRARVIEYESKISAPRVNTDLLKLIKVYKFL